MVSFPSGECVGDAVNNQTNYQFYLSDSHTFHD